jgi:hypothetical protein
MPNCIIMLHLSVFVTFTHSFTQNTNIKWLKLMSIICNIKSGDPRSHDIYPIFFMISHLLLGLTIHISNFRQSKHKSETITADTKTIDFQKSLHSPKNILRKSSDQTKNKKEVPLSGILILNKLFSAHRTLLEFVLIYKNKNNTTFRTVMLK